MEPIPTILSYCGILGRCFGHFGGPGTIFVHGVSVAGKLCIGELEGARQREDDIVADVVPCDCASLLFESFDEGERYVYVYCIHVRTMELGMGWGLL